MNTQDTAVTRPAQPGRRVVLWFIVLVLIVLGILVGLRNMVQAPPRSLPVLARLPEAPLLERTGEQTSLSALTGRVLIIDLQEAGCGAVCEERNRQMKEIQEYVAPVGQDVYQLSIRSEPISLEQLNRYATSLGSKEGWRWFTTDTAHFKALQQTLLPDAKADLALIDRWGNLRRRYLTTRPEDRRELMLDVRALARERKPTEASAR